MIQPHHNIIHTRLLTAIVLAIVSCTTLWAKTAVDLDSLYRCLDNAIDSSDYYVEIRKAHINSMKRELSSTHSQQESYRLCYALYDVYRSFKNDSAVAYLNRCIDIATSLGMKQRANECKALLAFQCSTTGMYPESLELLQSVDTTQMDNEGWRSYIIANQHLYNELYYYTNVPWLKAKYDLLNRQYTALLLNTLNHDDDQWLLHKTMEYYNKHDYKAALSVNNEWLKTVEPGSHRYAIAAFYRFLVYSDIGNDTEACRWLAESAISDVRNAVMDQGSLWELANRMSAYPDNLQRAYKYIRFAWTAANTFNTRVRSNQISPVLSLIEMNYQRHITAVNTRLRIAIGVVCIFFVIVAALLVYANKQRDRLQRARNQLDKKNNELNKLNLQLSDYNSRLNALNQELLSVNTSLDESNKMKELYLGRFLSLCQTYMDKTETLKRGILKHMKSKDWAGLAKMAEKKSDNLDEFYHNFDSAFLKLFPDFVSKFNALLRPEERIEQSTDHSLNTTLRIFALIRLGIDDSSRIAEFLHYSVNTIYNYRAKVKNGALGDRSEFESQVKLIGMESLKESC